MFVLYLLHLVHLKTQCRTYPHPPLVLRTLLLAWKTKPVNSCRELMRQHDSSTASGYTVQPRLKAVCLWENDAKLMDLYKLGDFRGTLFSDKHIDVIGLTDALVILRTSDQTILMPTLKKEPWNYGSTTLRVEPWPQILNMFETCWNIATFSKTQKPFPHSRPWASPMKGAG